MPAVDRLRDAIQADSVQMLGVIRQEILSGIRDEAHFEKLQSKLEGFRDLLATSDDHLVAAKFFNACRRKGVQGSHSDFLICAQAFRRELPILTMDVDFRHYAKVLPIELELI